MRIVYRPHPGDDTTVEAFGMTFHAGRPVELTGEDAEKAAKLAGNPTFVLTEANGDGDAAPLPAPKKVDGRSREARQAKEAAEQAAKERAEANGDGDGDDEDPS